MLLTNDILDAEAKIAETICNINQHGLNSVKRKCQIRHHTLRDVLCANVEYGIVQRATHQEFETKVVDTLGVGQGLTLLSPVPLLDQTITDGEAGGRVCGRLVAVEQATSQVGLDVANDLFLELILGPEAFKGIFVPSLTLRLGNRG